MLSNNLVPDAGLICDRSGRLLTAAGWDGIQLKCAGHAKAPPAYRAAVGAQPALDLVALQQQSSSHSWKQVGDEMRFRVRIQRKRAPRPTGCACGHVRNSQHKMLLC